MHKSTKNWTHRQHIQYNTELTTTFKQYKTSNLYIIYIHDNNTQL